MELVDFLQDECLDLLRRASFLDHGADLEVSGVLAGVVAGRGSADRGVLLGDQSFVEPPALARKEFGKDIQGGLIPVTHRYRVVAHPHAWVGLRLGVEAALGDRRRLLGHHQRTLELAGRDASEVPLGHAHDLVGVEVSDHHQRRPVRSVVLAVELAHVVAGDRLDLRRPA